MLPFMHGDQDEEFTLWQKFGWNAIELWILQNQVKLDVGAAYSQLTSQ